MLDDTRRAMCAITVVMLWLGLFYWLRLSKTLGFYIYLIMETFKDVKSFLGLFFILLCANANGLYILTFTSERSFEIMDQKHSFNEILSNSINQFFIYIQTIVN